jgi:Rrf2 family iron-sulfur cluster assembly transcriptional regulator
MDLSDQIHEFLNAISIGDLIEKKEIRDVAQRQDKDAQKSAASTSSEAINDNEVADLIKLTSAKK